MNIYVWYYSKVGGPTEGCEIFSLDQVLSAEMLLDRLEYHGTLVILSPFQT